MDNRAQLEVIAPTIEEAVEKGLKELGLPEDAVDIEVLDTGSRGLFGLGTRQARIRLTIKEAQPPMDSVDMAETKYTAAPLPDTTHPEDSRIEQEMTSRDDLETADAETRTSEYIDEVGESEDALALEIASDTVRELLDKMHVNAEVTALYDENEEVRGKTPIFVNITGQDLSILIGRQTETLNALQYITSLIVGKELGRSVPLIIDVEGYRKRREKQIRQLARRMADQAIKTGKRQFLEPMPANERRLVHIELRDYPGVATESVGEDPRRKVTIIPG